MPNDPEQQDDLVRRGEVEGFIGDVVLPAMKRIQNAAHDKATVLEYRLDRLEAQPPFVEDVPADKSRLFLCSARWLQSVGFPTNGAAFRILGVNYQGTPVSIGCDSPEACAKVIQGEWPCVLSIMFSSLLDATDGTEDPGFKQWGR